MVEDIRSACRAQFLLSTENDFENVHSYAIKIWERLSNLDSWYSIELKLINNIFFLFPLDTGTAIVERALREINKFSYINGNYRLKPAYLLNMTLLLINNRQFPGACRYADQAIQECAGALFRLRFAAVRACPAHIDWIYIFFGVSDRTS
ncbi:Rgg family transcriptional regulator [Sporolactobacillus putidus]|uniref:Rgg family transcriptional regulator n=1 Tax=Sporolactobacillus putidus TaxID=492735 RepID=UPI0035712B7F